MMIRLLIGWLAAVWVTMVLLRIATVLVFLFVWREMPIGIFNSFITGGSFFTAIVIATIWAFHAHNQKAQPRV